MDASVRSANGHQLHVSFDRPIVMVGQMESSIPSSNNCARSGLSRRWRNLPKAIFLDSESLKHLVITAFAYFQYSAPLSGYASTSDFARISRWIQSTAVAHKFFAVPWSNCISGLRRHMIQKSSSIASQLVAVGSRQGVIHVSGSFLSSSIKKKHPARVWYHDTRRNFFISLRSSSDLKSP